MSDAPPGDLRVAEHFVLLVYPFRHQLSGPARAERLGRLGAVWRSWWTRLDDGQLRRTLDDTWFFLPYVRQLLFPETDHLPHAEPEAQMGAARRLTEQAPASLDGRLRARHAVLRLTYDPTRLRSWGRLSLEQRREDRDNPGKILEEFTARFTLDWADVALFPQRVGLLLMKVRLDEERPGAERLRTFYGYLRQVLRPAIDWQLPRWVATDGQVVRSSPARALVDFLLQGFTEDTPPTIQPDLGAFLAHIESAPPDTLYTARQHGQSYGQFFHTYSCACLAEPPPAPTAADPLAAPFTRTLYELGTLTDSSNPNFRPHPSALARLLRQHRIAAWDNWQGLALHDGVVFLGREDTPFLRRSVLGNMEEDYFHLYLLVLFQKAWLSMTFGDLIQRDENLRKNLRQAQDLWRAFIRFQNHCWFSEVTRRPQGHLLYRRFQRALNVRSLYQEMSEEVQALKEHFERIDERSMSRLLAFLTVVGLPTGLVSQIYSEQLRELLPSAWWLTALLIFGVSGGAWLACRKWLHRGV